MNRERRGETGKTRGREGGEGRGRETQSKEIAVRKKERRTKAKRRRCTKKARFERIICTGLMTTIHIACISARISLFFFVCFGFLSFPCPFATLKIMICFSFLFYPRSGPERLRGFVLVLDWLLCRDHKHYHDERCARCFGRRIGKARVCLHDRSGQGWKYKTRRRKQKGSKERVATRQVSRHHTCGSG